MGPDDDGGELTTWTLGAIKKGNLALEGYCQTEGCKRFYVFDLDAMIGGLGANYVVPEYLPGVSCKACGGRLKFMLATQPPAED